MTNDERSVYIVRARLAGVHPLWIKWFNRTAYDPKAAPHADMDLEYVTEATENGYESWTTSPMDTNPTVREYLRKHEGDDHGQTHQAE